MGGRPSPFGIDEENLETAIKLVLKKKSINFQGIHLFSGTQILDYETLLRQYRSGLKIAERATEISSTSLYTVDFGGGFGIPYFYDDKVLDIQKFGKELSKIISTKMNIFPKTKFIVEPGRYLVGEGGIYVTTINTIKKSKGKIFIIVDGGMNHHLAASGNLGQVIKKNFPVAILNKMQSRAHNPVDIVGPLCTPLDVIARNVEIPKAEIGDLIGIFQSGAYARAASPLNFLSHPGPAEVCIEKNEAKLIRRRGIYEDFIQDIPDLS
jgi:diaminopimelate decarboxylase